MRTTLALFMLVGVMTVPGIVDDALEMTPPASAAPNCPPGTSGSWPTCVPNVPNCHYDGDLTFYCHF